MIKVRHVREEIMENVPLAQLVALWDQLDDPRRGQLMCFADELLADLEVHPSQPLPDPGPGHGASLDELIREWIDGRIDGGWRESPFSD